MIRKTEISGSVDPKNEAPSFPFLAGAVVVQLVFSTGWLPLACATDVKVSTYRGSPCLFMEGEPVFPMFYLSASCPDKVPANRQHLQEMRTADVNVVITDVWLGWDGWRSPGVCDYASSDSSSLARRLESIIETCPDMYVIFRVNLSPPVWWESTYPEDMMLFADGTRKGPSWASDRWVEQASVAIRDLIRQVERLPSAERVIGYEPNSREWCLAGVIEGKYGDYSQPMIEAFQDWLRRKYLDERSLQRSWKDPSVAFASATLPTPAQRMETDCFTFRNPSLSRRALDFYEFLSDMLSGRAIHFCKIVKEETQNRKLAGAMYGYIMEGWGNLDRIQGAGHLALLKVLNSPWVDYLASPYSYHDRRIGKDGPFMLATESVKLHGKLYLCEVDDYYERETDKLGFRLQDLHEGLAVMKRCFANALTHNVGLWWFDMWNGAYSNVVLLEAISKMKRTGDLSLSFDRASAAEIAVVVDEKSLLYVKPDDNLFVPLIKAQRQEYAKMGAPYDVYLLDDLADKRVPNYRMYLFPNAFHVTDAQRRAIERKVQRGGSVAVWMYAPGFVDENLSVASMSSLIGMEMAREEASRKLWIDVTTLDHSVTKALPKGMAFGTDNLLGPVFFAKDDHVVVLGRYRPAGRFESDGKPGFCLKKSANWTSVYIGTPSVPSNILRGIAKYAGVHVYGDSDDVLYANRNFIALHVSEPGNRRIALSRRSWVYDVFDGKLLGRDVDEFVDRVPRNSTSLYFVGSKSEFRMLERKERLNRKDCW